MTEKGKDRLWQFLISTTVIVSNINQDGTSAQIIPDNTLGEERSIVTSLDEVTERINGGAVRGANLFHSFREFNIEAGRGAYFANPAVIEHIFSRVTGNHPSHLLGTLGVLGNANLYFLNPNGIIFGPNASLDIKGSFTASTADSLLFPDGSEFSANQPQTAPMLTVNVSVPTGLLFANEAPTGILNAGRLEVGQNLTLVGGTVTSTGQLIATQGGVNIATIGTNLPGYQTVAQLNETGQVLSPVMQVSDVEVIATREKSLSELVAGSEEDLGLSVNGTGQIELSASGSLVEAGDIAIMGNAGQVSLEAQQGNLYAAQNLTLVDTTLGTVEDLQLLANDTVRIRDGAAQPFVAAAGGELLIQGNEAINIFALNHADSGLFSGGDLVLRSTNTIVGDAHYWSGSNFRIEDLDGALGELLSIHDPVIRSLGDVSFDGYQGASLHIIAGGKVDIPGSITINSPDFLNGLFDVITLSTGTNILIDGFFEATLDIRAGVDPSNIGMPIGQIGLGIFSSPVLSTPIPNSADIVIGDVMVFDNFSSGGGKVFLTNQYFPNTSLSGSITVNSIDTQDFFGGGSISLDSRGDITLNGPVNASSFLLSLGDGEDITLLAEGGITTNSNILSRGISGGDITIKSNQDISLTNNLLGTDTFGDGGRAGDITIESKGRAGDITIESKGNIIFAGSVLTTNVRPNVQGDVGTIDIRANSISFTSDSQLQAGFFSGGQGEGGLIYLKANDIVSLDNSDILTNSESFAVGDSSDINIIGRLVDVSNFSLINADNAGIGDAGEIFIKADNLINVKNSNIFSNIGSSSGAEAVGKVGTINLEAKSISLTDTSQLQAGIFSGGKGEKGGITLQATDSISLTNNAVIFTNTEAESIGNGGDIEISGRSIFFFNSQLNSNISGTGDAGKISITATDTTSLIDVLFLTSVISEGIGNGGNVEITVDNGSISLNNSDIFTSTSDQASQSGDINIIANLLTMTNDSNLGSSSIQGGGAGNITIITNESVILDKGSSFTASVGGSVDSGNILIETEKLSIRNGSGILGATFGDQSAGNLTINASNFVEIIGSIESMSGDFIGSFLSLDTFENGDAGSLAINTRKLVVQDGAFISASSFSGASGNGGSIQINASDFIELSGTTPDNLSVSAISSDTASEGDAGSIRINTGSLTVSDGARVSSLTVLGSTGQGGTVEIDADESVEIIGTRPLINFIPSSLNTSTAGTGNAGDIRIVTENLIVRDGAEISSATSASGQGGNIEITASESVTITDSSPNLFPVSQLTAVTNFSGNAGDITVKTPRLSVMNNAIISALTSDQGNAGNIVVEGAKSVTIGTSGDLIVESSDAGQAGDIFITTDTLTIGTDARLSATATETSTSEEDAGNIIINATNLNISGELGIFAETQSDSDAGTLTIQPNNNQPDLNIDFTDEGFISASTSASGDGGDINISAPETINLTGEGSIAVSTSGSGNAGEIEIRSQQLNLSDGIDITASTSGIGQAGDINIIVDESIILEGEGTSILASTEAGSTGNGGNIFIDPETVIIRDGAIVAVNSQGTGTGGDIELQAGNLTLDSGTISAETLSTDGGNITLRIQDFLLLRNGSLISTTAGTALAGGNGGNIIIDAGFVIAIPEENSDIIANAFEGNGGNILITTQGLFGLAFRSELTDLSDITVSSALGIDGVFVLEDTGIDPTRGLEQLPNVVETIQLELGCRVGGGESRAAYFETGHGGTPQTPEEPLNADTVTDWIAIHTESEAKNYPHLPISGPISSTLPCQRDDHHYSSD